MTIKYDGTVTLAVASSRRAAVWKNKTLYWSQLLDKIKESRNTINSKLIKS